MEYNEPLNLSIKKRPIAVVTPSSSSSSSSSSLANNKIGSNPLTASTSVGGVRSITPTAESVYTDENDDLSAAIDNDSTQLTSPTLNKEIGTREHSDLNDAIDSDAVLPGSASPSCTPNGVGTESRTTLSITSSSSSSHTASTAATRITPTNSPQPTNESGSTLSSLLSTNHNHNNNHISSALAQLPLPLTSVSAPPASLASSATIDQSPTHNLSLVDLLYSSTSNSDLSGGSHLFPSFDTDAIEVERNGAGLRATGIDASTSALASNRSTAISTSVTATTATSTSAHQTKLTTSIADATKTLTAYLNQQQSLDIAKMHLEQYLKITNQYLHSTLEGANMTSNEQINHLIRTNILTNKIAANNLISIINKLLEQNIISEYYFKHASRLMMQSYDGALLAADNKLIMQTPSVDDANRLLPSSANRRHVSRADVCNIQRSSDDDGDRTDDDDDDDDVSCDNASSVTHNELPDYDDTIKKETIPIASSPFMSYLHMHFGNNRIHQEATAANNRKCLDVVPLLAPPPPPPPLTKTKYKSSASHRKQSDSSNSNTTTSNNNNYSKSTKHHIPYDLSLTFNQRLRHAIRFYVFVSICWRLSLASILHFLFSIPTLFSVRILMISFFCIFYPYFSIRSEMRRNITITTIISISNNRYNKVNSNHGAITIWA